MPGEPHRLHVHVAIRPARDRDVPVGARDRQARRPSMGNRSRVLGQLEVILQGGHPLHTKSTISVRVAGGVHHELRARHFNVAVSVERSLDRHGGVRQVHKVNIGCGTDGNIRKPHRLHVHVAIIARDRQAGSCTSSSMLDRSISFAQLQVILQRGQPLHAESTIRVRVAGDVNRELGVSNLEVTVRVKRPCDVHPTRAQGNKTISAVKADRCTRKPH